MTQPYTDADVELVAEVVASDLDLEAWQVRPASRAALSALAAAGRLAPRNLRFRFDGEAPFRAMRTSDGRIYHPSDVWFVLDTEEDTDGRT